MKRYLPTLEDENSKRSAEEYLGAFTESLKMILKHNPVERIGLTVLLAAKTALRLRAANSEWPEHEIAGQLQRIARNIRLTSILRDLTPEEKSIMQLHPRHAQAKSRPRPSKIASGRTPRHRTGR
jgi:hypothetical protein